MTQKLEVQLALLCRFCRVLLCYAAGVEDFELVIINAFISEFLKTDIQTNNPYNRSQDFATQQVNGTAKTGAPAVPPREQTRDAPPRPPYDNKDQLAIKKYQVSAIDLITDKFLS